jgi:N-acetylglutamate synthase-like GNAT family acetyltransferase
VEPEDAKILADPRGQILRRGGAVLFARLDRYIVGTCALVRHAEDFVELTKMAVRRNVRGYGIGRRLAVEAIARARGMGAERLFLQTSPRDLGFVQIAAVDNPFTFQDYQRCSIPMVLDLTGKNSASPPAETS